MNAAGEIVWAGVGSARRHRVRSLATIACIVVALTPFLVGIALADGFKIDAQAAADVGPDLYVTAEQFGRPAPLPIAEAHRVRQIPGVAGVVPRIVGRVELGLDRIPVTIVGLSPNESPPPPIGLRGRLASTSRHHEFVIGHDLAQQLNLTVGSMIPPFYRNPSGERIAEIVGILPADAPPSHARLILTSFASAAHIFDQPGLATDLLVNCRPGYADAVRQTIIRQTGTGSIRLRVLTRGERADQLLAMPRTREGTFAALFTLAFAVSAMGVLVTSGAGLTQRRREVGILKALGWHTEQVLLRAFAESVMLALAGVVLAVLMAYLWLRGLNGYVLTAVFVPGVGIVPGFLVPFRLIPGPALLGLLVALVVVLTGTLAPTWRAASAPPREAMR